MENMTLVWIGLSVGLMMVLEQGAGALLARTEIGRRLGPGLWEAARLHLFEAIVTVAIGLGGVIGAAYQFGWTQDWLWGRSWIGEVTFFLLEGYLLYHGARMLRVEVQPRALIIHHLLMIVPFAWLWNLGALYPYALLMAIPSLSAALRDTLWFRRKLRGRDPKIEAFTCAAIALLDSIPPLGSLVHFFLVGRNQGSLPISLWALVILPSFVIVGLAVTFACGAIQKLVRFWLSPLPTSCGALRPKG
jgi:hypothetical protein